MNNSFTPELEQRLLTLLDYVGGTIEKTDSFVSEQAPLVAQELVVFGRALSVTHLLVYAAIMVFGLWLGKVCLSNAKNSCNGTLSDEQEFVAIGVSVVSGFGSAISVILGVVGVMNSLNYVAMAWFAPRLYILDYLRDFL